METNIIIFMVLAAVMTILPVITLIKDINVNKEMIDCYQRFLEKNSDISKGLKETIELHKKFHKESIKDFRYIIFCFIILGGAFIFVLTTLL